MEEIVLFFMSFLFVFLIYQIFVIIPAKRRYKDKINKNREKKELPEIKYLEKKYNLDMEKVSYFQLLQIVAFVSSFDISLIVSIIMLVENFIFRISLGFLLTFIIIFSSYHLVYLFYKKKGMIKNV